VTKHLVVLLAIVFAPMLASASEAVSKTYTGFYFYNFENSSFTPSGSSECWDIRGYLPEAQLVPADGSDPWGSAVIVIRGTLGPRGHFGNQGVCTRQLKAVRVIKVLMKCSDADIAKCSNYRLERP
jgi:hypothetical protein